MTIPERLAAFRRQMERHGIDVAIIPTADSHASEYIAEHFKTRVWLSGFTGSAGTLVVEKNEAALFVDGRYFIQAERQLAGSGIRLMRMGMAGTPTLNEYIASLLGAGMALGMDMGVVSGLFVKGIRPIVEKAGATLVDTGDLFASIWEDRPALPDAKVFLLDERYAGRSAAQKIADIRAEMAKAGAKLHVTNVLDEIAWILNVRGGDVANTPVVMSYLTISESECCWFVDGEKLSDEIRKAMAEAGVTIRGYDEIAQALAKTQPGTPVLIDPNKLTLRLINAMGLVKVIEGANPAFLMKACKNETELDCIRNAHIRDGAAVTRLMYWLKKNVGKIPMDEVSVSDHLLALREEQVDFISPSFDTICAYRANAAMMHYKATPESCAVIEPQGMLLIDSGGQYYDGTTDITRTFVLGEITQEQKEHFTAVLCSMINLASAKFLYGCTGVALDVLARGPIWDLGIDYRCGTGHGVGFLLSVHEGPNGFRWYVAPPRTENTVLEAGMLTSDEPGIYIEGSHGIRTENLMICKKLECNEYGQFMGFETVTCVPIDLDAVIPEQMTKKQKDWLNAYHAWVRENLAKRMGSGEERAWLNEATRAI